MEFKGRVFKYGDDIDTDVGAQTELTQGLVVEDGGGVNPSSYEAFIHLGQRLDDVRVHRQPEQDDLRDLSRCV